MNGLHKSGSFNWLLLANVLCLGILGIVNLSSAAREAGGNLEWIQALWLGFGLLLAILLAVLDYRILDRLAYPFFACCLLALLAVLFAGRVVQGSRRWIHLLFFNFQPSEMMKIALILALAKYFSDIPELPERGFSLRDLIKPATPFYPVGATGALILFWEKLEVIQFRGFQADIGKWRYVLAGLLLVWFAVGAVWLTLRRKNFRVRLLFMPPSPIYAVLAGIALLAAWRHLVVLAVPAFRAEIGPWRFVLLALCLVWAAASVLWALRSGRTSLHDLLSPVLLVVLPAILILRQPDLGTALVLFFIFVTVILFAKLRWFSLLIAAAALALFAVAAWHLALKGYQKERLLSFMEPTQDVMGSGYHALQSMIAVGSGRTTGKGFGESTQTQFKFLPEQHTDFVFSVWAEEWGFAGCLLVLGLFFFLLLQVVEIASGAREHFGVLLTVGVAGMVFWQIAINVGMVIGALPVVGITLPLWSYGGSSVLAVMMSVGLVLSVSLRRGTH